MSEDAAPKIKIPRVPTATKATTPAKKVEEVIPKEPEISSSQSEASQVSETSKNEGASFPSLNAVDDLARKHSEELRGHLDQINDLERKVHANERLHDAEVKGKDERIKELQDSNASLQSRVDELESQLVSAKEKPNSGERSRNDVIIEDVIGMLPGDSEIQQISKLFDYLAEKSGKERVRILLDRAEGNLLELNGMEDSLFKQKVEGAVLAAKSISSRP